jgi:hypothetical protein
VTVIVISYTLVFLWHQENVQIRTRLEMTKIYPTLLCCPGQYILVDDAAYTLTDQLLCPFVRGQRESTNKDE